MYVKFTDLVDFVGNKPPVFQGSKSYVSTAALKSTEIAYDDIEIIKPIIEKASLHKLNKPYEMIMKKIEIEEELGGDKQIGLAIFSYYQGKKKLEEWFNVKEKDIKNELNLVKTYLEGDERGEKFLEQFK